MIRFTVIGGYLGAGKTTLLNQILSDNDDIRFALLINDFGEINIDAQLIESETDSQINLTNGCVCCTLVDGFHEAIARLRELDPPPDHIVVEASGVADVANLAQYGYTPELQLDGVLVLADAETVVEKARDKYVARTVQRQLASADIIILNKTDLVTTAVLEKRLSWLHENYPDTTIIESSFGRVPLSLLLGVHQDLEVAAGHADHESYITWKWEFSSAVSEAALNLFVEKLPATVIRAKGFAQIEDGSVKLVQVVGRRKEILPSDRSRQGTLLTAIGLERQLDPIVLSTLAKSFLQDQTAS